MFNYFNYYTQNCLLTKTLKYVEYNEFIIPKNINYYLQYNYTRHFPPYKCMYIGDTSILSEVKSYLNHTLMSKY